jgi:hypothetical protein
MASVFSSSQKPKSAILQQSFSKRLSALWGWQGVTRDRAQTDFERSTGLRFLKVDIGNDAYRVKHASLGSIFKSAPLATTLNKYFNAYINETTLVYSDIAERQQRLNELRFAVLNDPFLSRVCRLVADEATQLDDQNRLLSVESPSVAFVNKCYELFSQWGLTQQRISAACYDLEQYGEALWAHRVTEKGVERIIPLKVPALKERLEFSPAHMAEVLAQMNGEMELMKNRGSKIDKLVTILNNNYGEKAKTSTGPEVSDLNDNFADTFDTKLLGFEFDDGIIVPPWLITHFRYQPDNSEFFPYGSPPLLMALAPFKQSHSTIALQGLARSASFPVQLYKVKNTEGASVAQAFETVNSVREDYENIGVSPMSNSLEVYTVNTKVWVPEGILDMQIIESKVDMDFTGDLEIFQDRVAIACGVPKAYLDQEFGGFGNSGISLVEQYKPFARHVYTIQSSFLEALGQLIRLNFAITGEFDYNIPFVLSMRFPAEDAGADKREARTAAIELANSIIEMLQGVLGMEEGEPLPEDVVSDILSKYTFLDPTDLQRWIRLSAITKAAAQAIDSEGEEEDNGEGDMSGGDDMGMEGDDAGDVAAEGGDVGGGEVTESMSREERAYYLKTKKLLREKLAKQLKEKKLRRLREVSERYKECKNEIYFQWLKEKNLTEWCRPKIAHELLVPQINNASPLWETFQAITSDVVPVNNPKKLTEITLQDHLNNTKPLYENLDEMLETPLRDIDDMIKENSDENISTTI